ncbi:MAG: hydrogenase iron-sulfur subunit [Thermoplasmata archaeon]|nr:MAG: hydrogenase iron-sulfur subunit [Thermoplasmata archaeon]
MTNHDFEPCIIAFCCNWCGYRAADSTGINNIEYPVGLRIIRIMCSGMVHPNYVMDAFTKGADGVMIFGCYREEDLRYLGPTKYKACHYIDGIKKAENRAEAIKLMLEDFGLEPERFKLEMIFASEGQKFAQIIKEMSEALKVLGPSPFRNI